MRLRFKNLQLAGMAALSLAAQTPRTPVYLGPEHANMFQVVQAAPANDSAHTWMELAELHRLQETRTPAEVAQAQKDDAEEDMFVFATVLGAKFSKAGLPATASLSDHVRNDISILVTNAKRHFARARPYDLDKTLKPVCKVNAGTRPDSCPSGHGSVGYTEALVLALMVPEKRDAILARAEAYGRNRTVCGVHYPEDLVASKAMAYSIIGALMSSPKFQKELEAAKSETRAALQ